MSSSGRDHHEPEVGGIAPIYRRLPKGPHGIDPQEVAHHQRIRMHGAMIESVATHGYEETSVRHVIGLAGVSRRAFYEQFANKEDCFMATFDLIVTRAVKRVNAAYQSSKGSLEARLRVAFRAFVEEVESNSKALHLVMIDAQTAGPETLQRLQKTVGMFEGLLSNNFSSPDRPDQIPTPVIRGIVGGLRRATFLRLRDGSNSDLPGLTEEMLRWFLSFNSPAAGELQLRRCARTSSTREICLPAAGLQHQGPRGRVLREAIDLVLREGYEEVSAPRIADEANLSIDEFLQLYTTMDDCFLDALDMLGEDLLLVVADPDLVSADWAPAACSAIERLLDYLVANPAYTKILASEMFKAGPRAIDNVVALSYEIATLLTEGAPRRPRSSLAVEGVAGALWHTVQLQAARDRLHLLPSLTEHLSYVVLAPFIGAEKAIEVITERRVPEPAIIGGLSIQASRLPLVAVEEGPVRGNDGHTLQRLAVVAGASEGSPSRQPSDSRLGSGSLGSYRRLPERRSAT